MGAWLAGRRLVAIDGTCLDVADTPDNDEFFGRPGVTKGERAAFPQARVVALAECGTHAIFDAEIGPYSTSEVDACRGGSWSAWGRHGGHRRSGVLRVLVVAAGRGHRRRVGVADAGQPAPRPDRGAPRRLLAVRLSIRSGNFKRRGERVVVRVVDYTIDDGRPNDETYRLFTTILDPDVASAADLAAAYAQRWEIEATFDELKIHQRGARTVLRSKSPDLVLQEIWGHLCCHFAIRTLMWEAADHAGVDPDRVSFVAALRIARRSIPAARDFPPSDD